MVENILIKKIDDIELKTNKKLGGELMNVNMAIILEIVLLFAFCIVFFMFGIFYRKKVGEKKIKSAEKLADDIIKKAERKLEDAQNEAIAIKNNAETRKKEILLDTKEECLKLKNDAEREIKIQKNELQQSEKRILQKEESLDKKQEVLDSKENILNKKIEDAELKNVNLEKIIEQQKLELQKISGLTYQQAKEIILDDVKKDATLEASKIIKEVESKTKAEADKKVYNILMNAMQRCNVDHVTETTVSVVNLPSEDMKGKIIGREGRNIRLLESLTGIDLIIDDTPEAIILSGFDPIRREIAKIALEKLVLDGRIHPARIEEVVQKSKNDMENIIFDEGEAATYETGIQNLNPEIIKLLGRMKYRTSYGQNALKHSIEVSHLCGLIAGELGVDISMAKRAGLLHDIGKSIDHETEGSHITIGSSLCKKYHEPEIVINAIEAHHGDVEPSNIISVIVQLADAISAARPGARRETLESYIKRLENLEKISDSFDGVEKSFAIHAGRELRIIVVPEKISDNAMPILARDIAKKIEEELQYPGQIKVNIIRETRAVEYAK